MAVEAAKETQYVYVVVRADIPRGHMATQAVHAGLQAGRELVEQSASHPTLVLLTAKNETHLLNVANECRKTGLKICVFREEDMGDQATAFAAAIRTTVDRRIFRRLPLLK